MPKSGDQPRPEPDSTIDRFLRFGTALFAVKKDEVPKRGEQAKLKRKKRPALGAPAQE